MAPSPSPFPAIQTPVPSLEVSGPLDALLAYAPVKALAPIPVILLVAPFVWLLFRGTWKELDEEARVAAREGTDDSYRPMVALVLLAVTLTIHEYYGGRSFYADVVEPMLRWLEASGLSWVQLELFSELYGYVWWALARIIGYVAIPILTWKVLFREDKILDMGLHVKGFFSHLGLYAVSLAVVLIAMAILSNQRDFLTYYPFYKGASRSWLDYLSWEACYFAQFFALEFYFRGFLLQALRKKMGSAAIFAVAVPYCMIHYGKPYLEAHGAIIAGVVLGSLAMKTRSIYAGFLVHIVVAALMDYYALASRNGIPTQFLP